jgi:hypothetical protein
MIALNVGDRDIGHVIVLQLVGPEVEICFLCDLDLEEVVTDSVEIMIGL